MPEGRNRRRNNYVRIVRGQPTIVGNKKSWQMSPTMEEYVAHIKNCAACNSEIAYYFMNGHMMASAILRTHTRSKCENCQERIGDVYVEANGLIFCSLPCNLEYAGGK